VQYAAVPTVFALSVATTLAWAWTGGVDQMGLPLGSLGDPTVSVPVSASANPELPMPQFAPPGPMPQMTATGSAPISAPATAPASASAADLAAAASAAAAAARLGGTPLSPTDLGLAVTAPPADPLAEPPTDPAGRSRRCYAGRNLVPTCGVLWGVAPGAHTESRGASALAQFERKTGRHQAIFHAYHGGVRQLFPTPQEIAIAREPGKKRILFLNWKPESTSWANIAKGDRRTDAYLDRLAAHINRNFHEKFFFAVHHEGENDVRPQAGSGYTARDYAAMYRHVINRLRARGVDNMVSVLVHMAYVKHAQQSWFNQMYPGDAVVDWIGLDTYAYSDPGYGHSNFAGILNRRIDGKGGWPGFYTWATTRHAGKPLMIAEWGVWSSKRNTQYKADFYRELGNELRRFPRIKAMVQFETPHNQKGQDSSVDSTPQALRAYRDLGRLPMFQVSVAR
jgi:Glycosyl hydrolase family 26